MSRAFLIVMDSVGCGGAPDSRSFNDEGANTLGHIIEQCELGNCEKDRSGFLKTPNLDSSVAAPKIPLTSFDFCESG